MLIHKAFRYKLKPTVAQEAQFLQFAGATRWVWNVMLAENRRRQGDGEPRLSWVEQAHWLTELKHTTEYGWLKTIHSQVLQEPIRNLERGYQNAFTKHAKMPTFKSRHRHIRFAYPQSVKVHENQVYLPKIGWVRFRKSRAVEGAIKRATITKQASGWHIAILCEVEVPEYGSIPLHESNTIGIDLGLRSFLVSSEGDEIPAPQYYRKAQRALSRKQKGSKRRRKQADKVARLHEHIANQRRDFLHKLSTALVRESQATIAEDLNVKGLERTRLAKSVHDVGWGIFLRMLDYKAKWNSKVFHQVNRFFPSSQLCHVCGTRNPLTLAARTFVCVGCGARVARDFNAAQNIKHQGLVDLSPAGTSGANAHRADVSLSLDSNWH